MKFSGYSIQRMDLQKSFTLKVSIQTVHIPIQSPDLNRFAQRCERMEKSISNILDNKKDLWDIPEENSSAFVFVTLRFSVTDAAEEKNIIILNSHNIKDDGEHSDFIWARPIKFGRNETRRKM